MNVCIKSMVSEDAKTFIIITCLELIFKASKVSFWVSVAQFLNTSVKITGTDLSFTTCNSLKNSIMDEDVLFLHNKNRKQCWHENTENTFPALSLLIT